jgi:hypothetical protein
MGQKMVCFGQLRPTRSRQEDESIEVGEVGSKRPSLGGNGGHVVWWIGLIFRLLLPLPRLWSECPQRANTASKCTEQSGQLTGPSRSREQRGLSWAEATSLLKTAEPAERALSAAHSGFVRACAGAGLYLESEGRRGEGRGDPKPVPEAPLPPRGCHSACLIPLFTSSNLAHRFYTRIHSRARTSRRSLLWVCACVCRGGPK